MVAEVVDILSVLLEHDIHQGILQQRVGAGSHGNPFVGLGGNLSERGINNHEFRAALHRLFDEMPILDLGIGDVRTPHHNGFGVFGVRRLVAFPHTHAHKRVDVVAGHGRHTVVASHIEARHNRACIEQGRKARIRACDCDSLIARGGEECQGAFAILLLRVLDIVGDFLQSLIPANALPLPGATLGSFYASHWVFQTLRVVNALDVR